MYDSTSRVAESLAPYGTSVFTRITDLANRHSAVNLSQGFPDFDGPLAVRRAAADAILEGPNQYAPSIGTPPLRKAVAAKTERFYGVSVCPDTEVTVTAGASEGLAAALLGLINSGDEVILLDPSYDLYPPMVSRAGAVPVHVPIGLDGALPKDLLAAAFSERTRAIVINNPQNPCGKVFTEAELSFVADLCEKHDALVIGDEVYEHLVYDGRPHRTLLAVPKLRSRAAVISSTAKTFSMTGWKVGYVIAAPGITAGIRAAHQFITFCTSAAFQNAMASAIASDDTYYETLNRDYTARRDRLSETLFGVGFEVLPTEGTYFLNVRIDRARFEDDLDFCERMTKEAGVAAVPTSFFYENRSGGRDIARFCFCKKDETLAEAEKRLSAWKIK